MITVNRVIIHEIKKEAQTTEAEVLLGESCLTINANNEDTCKTRELIKKLNNSYKSDKQIYAIFNQAEDMYFPAQFNLYNGGVKNNDTFINFTQNVTNNLRNQIMHINLAKGGFCVFSDYMNDGISFFGVYIIRDTQGLIFNRDETTNDVQIESVTYVNTDKLVLACRINIAKFENQDGKYLTFLKRTQQEVSNYFTTWLCSDQPESSKEFTENLYNIVNSMPLPNNPDTGAAYEINDYRKKVSSYIKENHNMVNLQSLGEHFYDNEMAFVNFRDENNIEIDNEFKADSRALSKFHLIDLNKGGIQLKFSRGLIDNEISLGANNKIIIDSPALRQALEQEINNQG